MRDYSEVGDGLRCVGTAFVVALQERERPVWVYTGLPQPIVPRRSGSSPTENGENCQASYLGSGARAYGPAALS